MTDREDLRPPLWKRWPDLLIIALLLLPGIVGTWLVASYAVDTPFFDDFTFLEDWIKFKKGELHLGDLFTAHMEHRVILPRFIALGLHLALGRDLRWQNVVTMLLVWGTGWNIARIFLRSTGTSLRTAWVPLFLMSLLIFCAIQWQGLLWPVCFEIFIPTYSLTLGISLWQSVRNPVLALTLAALCAAAGTISFASGALSWVLMLPLLWFLRDDLNSRERIKFGVAWLITAGVALFLYTHNFKNTVPEQFAYGQGKEVTIDHGATYFFQNPDKAVGFVSAFLGCHLSRGLHLQNISAAQAVGGASWVLFLVCIVYLWVQRKNTELLKSAMPWIAIGGYSIGTGFMVAVGRMWLTRSGSLAITGRYITHAIPLTVALIALLFIIGRQLIMRMPRLSQLGTLAAGGLAMLTTMEWVYGARNMELWQEARLQGQALLLFANVFPSGSFLGPVSGDAVYGQNIIKEMDRLGLLRQPLLKTLDLNQREFHKSSANLRPRLGQFEMLLRSKDGGMETEGFAELPNQRPADLILFSWAEKPGTETIFGITTLERVPRYYSECTLRDHEFCSVTSFGPDINCQWSKEVAIASMPLENANITAWALDLEKRRIFRVDDARAQPGVRLPKGIYRNSEGQRTQEQ